MMKTLISRFQIPFCNNVRQPEHTIQAVPYEWVPAHGGYSWISNISNIGQFGCIGEISRFELFRDFLMISVANKFQSRTEQRMNTLILAAHYTS